TKSLENGRNLIESIKGAKLNYRLGQIQLTGDGTPSIEVAYRRDNITELRGNVQYFATLSKEVAKNMPGSVVSAEMFLETLGVNARQIQDEADTLMNNQESKLGNFIFRRVEEDGFELNVFKGSTNTHTLQISRLANDEINKPYFDFKDDQLRAKYQKEIAQVIRPVLEHKPVDGYHVRIVEDCIASGDTIIGALSLLIHKDKLKEGETVRVDVSVATTQGILLLREFAKQNGIRLKINAGYLAYGLSEGIKDVEYDVRDHANYLVYPDMDEFGSLRQKQVVADMGEGLKSFKDRDGKKYLLPWNVERGKERDSHGDHEERPDEALTSHTFLDRDYPYLFVFANGGYGMHAYHQWINKENRNGDLKATHNVVVMRASRLWSINDELGYGVALAEIPEKLFD
ncbi:hypothetical protein HY041_02320, partial [Candidatus Roizmanbacteria bacterium]|nr:hypothetical protein [Candidatus Roizmanbacteria bacterium]